MVMNAQENVKCYRVDYVAENVSDIKYADNILKAAALFLFLLAAISQWLLGYYAADYYDDSIAPNTLQFGNIKAKPFEIPNKNFMNINFKCGKSLISFDIKK
jgi:hypothetical protein